MRTKVSSEAVFLSPPSVCDNHESESCRISLVTEHVESMGSIQKIQETCASLSSDGKTVRDQVYGLLGVVKALPTKDDIMEDINTSSEFPAYRLA